MVSNVRLGFLVILLAATACVVRPEQETPPEPTTDRPPTPSADKPASAGSSGSSERIANENDTGVSPTALASCSAMCDRHASLATDCPADAASQCKALCKLVLQTMDAKCQDTAAQWTTCMKDNVDPAKVACSGSNVPSATIPAACEAITVPYTECQKAN